MSLGPADYNSDMRIKHDRSSDRTKTSFIPLEQVTVVRQNPETQQREVVQLVWGLIPSWACGPSIGSRLVHARCKTAASKPAFRESFRQRRCLVVADSFDIGRRRGKGGSRYLIQMKDGKPFGVGSIWDRWEKEGLSVESCAIITTAANDLVWPINDRMPVIIAQEDYGRWLDPQFFDARELERMMQPYPEDAMIVVPGG